MSRTPGGVAALTLAIVALAGCSATGGTSTMPSADSSARPSASAGQPPAPSGDAVATPTSAGPPGAPIPTGVPPVGRPTPLSRTSPPVLPRPSTPPKTPSDLIVSNGWVVGTVVQGGAGPCYRLQTDDGTEYAMHSTAGMTLTRGDRIRVKVTPAIARIHCGPGRPVSLDAVEPLR